MTTRNHQSAGFWVSFWEKCDFSDKSPKPFLAFVSTVAPIIFMDTTCKFVADIVPLFLLILSVEFVGDMASRC